MDAELIAEHSSGIIATTGCPSGEVQARLRLGHDREAPESAAKWREIFGADNYFLELMDHGLDIERRVRDGLLDIGQKLGIPPLATNDCLYVTRDAAHNHEALLCVQTGNTLSDANRFKFDGDGYYLKSVVEMCFAAMLDRNREGAPQDTGPLADVCVSGATQDHNNRKVSMYHGTDILRAFRTESCPQIFTASPEGNR